MTGEQIKHFSEKVAKNGHDECWEWQGTKTDKGYGQVRLSGVTFYSHRISWELFFGPIPNDKWVLHKCNNPSCVNPYHLYLGTSSDNVMDAVRNGTHGAFQLRLLDSRERDLVLSLTDEGNSQRKIASLLGVSRHVVQRIVENSRKKER